MSNMADIYFSVIDELEAILKNDERTFTIKEYVVGEKEQGLQFPTLFILPEEDTQTLTAKTMSRWSFKLYLVLVYHDLDVQRGKKVAMRMAWDIQDILTEQRDLNGKVTDVLVDRITHNTGKDNQNRVIHWEMLELTISINSRERK